MWHMKLKLRCGLKMTTAGAGGRVVLPTEFLSLLGTPQRLSFAKAIPVSFAKNYA
jgi:hypothetical protein